MARPPRTGRNTLAGTHGVRTRPTLRERGGVAVVLSADPFLFSPSRTTAFITACHIGGGEERQMMSDTADSEDVDVEQFAGDTVRLTTAITAVLNSPAVVVGEVSGSGKTIAVNPPHKDKTLRLDTATIMAGDSEFRGSRSYTLYSREDFQSTQRANYGPGPQAGADGETDAADLPEPTHTVAGSEGEDADGDEDPGSSGGNPGGEGGKTVMTDGGVTTDGGEDSRPDPQDTWKYREGEDGHPVFVRDEGDDVAVEFEREDGADSSDATLTYIQRDGESVTISPGDTILGPDGEDVVTVTGYTVTVDPYLAVECYVDLPPEDGGGVPYSPHAFAIRFLGYEDNDGFHFHMGECTAASGEDLEQARWADTVDTLRTLDEGDRILWGERSTPLTVTDAGLWASEYVSAEGPRGGEYTIHYEGGVPTVRRGYRGDSLGRPEDLTVVSRAGEDTSTDGGRLMTDGGVATDGGEDSEGRSAFESAVRRRMSEGWSLASGVWRLEDESSTYIVDGEDRTTNRVMFYHRDSISRILVSSSGGGVDSNVTVEVFRPLSKADARQGPDDDVNDLTVTAKTFDLLGEAVWFAEYFARTADERIPEDPATNLYGPVDGDGDE